MLSEHASNTHPEKQVGCDDDEHWTEDPHIGVRVGCVLLPLNEIGLAGSKGVAEDGDADTDNLCGGHLPGGEAKDNPADYPIRLQFVVLLVLPWPPPPSSGWPQLSGGWWAQGGEYHSPACGGGRPATCITGFRKRSTLLNLLQIVWQCSQCLNSSDS